MLNGPLLLPRLLVLPRRAGTCTSLGLPSSLTVLARDHRRTRGAGDYREGIGAVARLQWISGSGISGLRN